MTDQNPNGGGLAGKLSDAAQRFRNSPQIDDAAVIWSAEGKPLKGFGGGRYRLTAEYLYFERGTLGLKAEQILIHEVRDVDAKQTMTQRARGLGTIALVVHRATGEERVELEDIPSFREGVTAINQAAHAARESLRQRENTQHVNYTGAPAPTVPVAAPSANQAGPDINGELAKLASFHEQGILDDAEFSAAKKKLLGL